MVCSHYSYMSALTGPDGVKPVTVCEVLANPGAYNGKNVALLGRLDDSLFYGSWLSEENCGSTLTTDGHTWPNKVWIGGGGNCSVERGGREADTIGIKKGKEELGGHIRSHPPAEI
jgi:hypothetical protein